MTGQRISVVVPFYNNVDLLADCLASIAAQTHRDLQVIMVDDGSADGSAEIARAQVAADPRFSLISVRNGGPGAARNIGVTAATGAFLAFVDADDVLPPEAYATMLAVLERSSSDFVSGGVLRLTAGLGRSGLHDRGIKVRRTGTHISRSPELFYDISVWNKLFRRSFWDASGLRLPEGMLWEDLVAMTQAHVLAGSVDVITDPVYHWRDRDKGAPSITQSRADLRNFRDRITALEMIDDFLRGKGTPAMLRQHQRKALVNDLWLYVGDLPAFSPDYRREFASLAAGYLRQVSRAVRDDLPAERKLAYYLVEHGRIAELDDFAAWLATQPGRTPPMVRVRGRLRADLPLRRDRQQRIPAKVFRPQWRELDPYVQVDAISWQDDAMVIEGSAYVPSMDIARKRSTTKILVLVPRGKRRLPVLLPVRSTRRPDVTAASGQDRYSYDWSGFRCRVSGGMFGAWRHWLTGSWDCYLLVRGRAAWRPVRLHSPGAGAVAPQTREVAGGLAFGAHWAAGRLQLRLLPAQPAQPPPVRQSGQQSWGDDGAMIVSGMLPATGRSGVGYQIVVRHADGADCHAVPVAAHGAGFTVAVAVAAMDTYGDRLPLRDGRWTVELCDAAGVPADIVFAVDASAITTGRKVYRCSANPLHRGLVLSVGPALRLSERGRIRRRLIRDIYYRAQRLLPVRDTILLSSFHGKQCADNPGAIARELRRRGDARPQVWAVSDWSVPVPPGATAVLAGTREYYLALARSGHVIINDHLQLPYRKRPGQRHVQTWHGTPLKHIGYDIGEPKFASGRRYFEYMASDVAQWDLLISPNPFSTPIMRDAFRFAGEICETGYPRNDALIAGRADEAGRIRRRLGLPDGKRVAMYVPTWRDNQHDADGRYLLDFRLDLAAASERLGADYVLLIRGHHLMAGGFTAGVAPGFAMDVTRYPDISDLLVVTDVLITDYSSVMFDFAPVGRPMIFFTYDLEQYRDHLRGFYFDFESQAPGPLVTTSDQVIAALADLDSVAAAHQAALATFAATFCPLDDGKASARACDAIFGS